MDMSHLGDCCGQDTLPLITGITAAGWDKAKLPLLLEQQGRAGTRCRAEPRGGRRARGARLSFLRC